MSKQSEPSPAFGVAAGSTVPILTQCPLCHGWHGGADGTACYKCTTNMAKRSGAYWLHSDGWYRLFPEASKSNNPDHPRRDT